ncbi:MAG: steroid 3-ketoacyl-CoA thiolase [Proteobacteria bacterium]|nr:MAG: steroid 3-ketoacyl-CoA thiolase [Pseudomonadota bacterium]
MSEAVIIEAVRTPFGRRGGALREQRPDSLLAHALKGLVQRAGVPADKIEDVVDGTVTLAGEQGANPARLAVLLADFPVQVPGVSLNRMCGSSQQALHFAAQAVAAGDMNYVIASGVESMTRTPMFLDISLGREGMNGFEALNPELFKHHDLIHQGESAERVAEKWSLSRKALDDYAKESHRRAFAAQQSGLNRELLPVQGVSPDAQPVTVNRDEGVRGVIDEQKMASLKPAFRPEGRGVITAANSSQISDGASAVLVANAASAKADGLKPKARFRARVVVGSDPTLQLTGVIPAARLALKRAGLSMSNIDWVEINEAFASVVLSWSQELGADLSRVNPWGGAIAHGHPLGATGGGLMAKMLAGLESTGGQFGLQVMCIGHGQATATIVERI